MFWMVPGEIKNVVEDHICNAYWECSQPSLGQPPRCPCQVCFWRCYCHCAMRAKQTSVIIYERLLNAHCRCNKTRALLCRIFCANHATSTELRMENKTKFFRTQLIWPSQMNEHSSTKVITTYMKAKWFQPRIPSWHIEGGGPRGPWLLPKF